MQLEELGEYINQARVETIGEKGKEKERERID